MNNTYLTKVTNYITPNTPIIIYALSFLPLAYISYTRNQPFNIFFENLELRKFILLSIVITAICVQYVYLSSSKQLKEMSTKQTLHIIFPILLILLFLLPLFSRDYLAYLIPARNLIEFKANPYTTVIDSDINDWGKYVSGIWKSGPTNYPPIFIGATSLLYFINSYSNNLYLHTITYKIVVFALFILSAVLLNKLLNKTQNQKDATFSTNLFILNPLLITSYILDGHNDIFLITLILLFLLTLYAHNNIKSGIIWGAGILVKYFTILLFPLLWFKDNKFNIRYFLYSMIFLLATAYILINISSGLSTRILLGQKVDYFNGCYYGCSVTTKLINSITHMDHFSLLIRIIIFIIGSFYLVIKVAKRSFIKYTFWIFFLFFFVLLSWQTPWSYTYPIVIGLFLASKKTYLGLVLIITCYAFLRYIGL